MPHLMKLSKDAVWTLTAPYFKLLKTVEFHQKSYEIVPYNKIELKHNNPYNTLYDLSKSKFLRYETLPYMGYKLTISGYDCLSINYLRKKGLQVFGDKIGVGKESDIYYGVFNNTEVALKFHRLGRTSFRSIKNNRDYHNNNKHLSWAQLSRISAEREYDFLTLFKGLEIPMPIIHDRHVIVMENLESYTLLNNAFEFNLDIVYCKLMDFIKNLYSLGYIHCDFNEFNIMVRDENIKVIDFPQCVDVKNERAEEYLRRDVECIKKFFARKFQYTNEYLPEIDVLTIK